MKDLGKTIAKYRKEHKLNQSQLAKELENYDIYVKQNSISAWELGTATPNARQFLALCEILEIYDIYTDFIGQSPLNPFRNLNENGMNKVLEYISDLARYTDYVVCTRDDWQPVLLEKDVNCNLRFHTRHLAPV